MPLLRCLMMVIFLFIFAACTAQGIKYLQLKNEKISLLPRNFRIAAVQDDRQDTGKIGSFRTGLLASKTETLQLAGGSANAIRQFLRINLRQEDGASPIALHITQLEVAEEGRSGLRSSNRVRMELSFQYREAKLVSFTAGGSAESTGDASKPLEEIIRGSLVKILEQFDDWWSRNERYYLGQNSKRRVRVEVTLDQEAEGDIISYSVQRPLTLADFQGLPGQAEHTAAVSFTIISLKYSSVLTMDNEIIVDVSIVPSFNKRKSWCRPESRNAETLAHEQRHFDISAIKACELVDTIRKFNFRVGQYSVELSALQRLKQAELDQLQDRYDRESGHGTGSDNQEKWSQWIADRLRQLKCYP